jgi:hypothetical protein
MAKIDSDKVKHDTIYEAFVAAQAEFETPKKTATLVVGGGQKRTYADLGAYLDAVKPALHKHGLALLQPVSFGADEISIQTVVADGKGDKIESPLLALPVDRTGNRNAVQALGSTITYARRYSLMCFLGLVGEDDDGETANMAKAQPKQQTKPASQPVAQPTQPALTEQQVWRNDALAWIANALQTDPYKSAWDADAIRGLLGKTSGEAADAELGALMATMQALPLGGGIIAEYHNNLGATA